jgi:outer membrane protein
MPMIKMRPDIVVLCWCFCSLWLTPFYGEAQEVADTLTLSEAITTALQRNLNIRVARNEATMAENNATLGNAGLLPQVGVEAGYNTAYEDVQIEFDGDQIPPIDRRGVRSSTYTASVGLNYLLFDGMGNFHRLSQLRLLSEAGGTQSRLQIENIILEVVQTYLEAARLQEVLRTDRLSLSLSADRLERLRVAYRFGVSTRLEMLNAEVDYRTDSVNAVISAINVTNASRNLNILLNKPPNTPLVTGTRIEVVKDLAYEDLLQRSGANNTFLRLAEQQVRLADAERKLVRSAAYPRISINGSYGITRNENEAGLLIFQQNVGFNGGAGLSWNLFNGRQRALQERNAVINLDNARASQETARLQTEAQVANAYDTYRNFLKLLDLEQGNLELARLNFEQTRDALRLGQATGTQFREAQLNLTQTEIRMTEVRYQAKQAEVELYRLAGLIAIE